MTRMHRLVTCSLAVVVCLQTSCAVPVRPEYAQQDKKSLGKVTVVAARFDPNYQFEALSSGKGEGTAKGALAGAGACGDALMGGPFGLLLALVCLPVGVIAGAIAGAYKAAPAQQVEEAKAAVQRGIAALKLQDEAFEAASRYGQQTGLDLGRVPQTTGPAKADDFPSYTEVKGVADTVIEISVLHATAFTTGFTTGDRDLRVSLGMQARIRVLSARDGKVIDILSLKYLSESRAVDEWLAGDGRAIKTESDHGCAWIAEQTIDEIMLIYHSKPVPRFTTPRSTHPEIAPKQPKSGETELVPPMHSARPNPRSASNFGH